MPCVTSAKWGRTLVFNIPIFITIWFSLQAALEVHFRLIIRHQVLGYRLNTYCLEVTGYSDDPWWREFYINFEFSRLQFGSCPISPTGDGPQADMEMNCLHMESVQITSQTQQRAGHLFRLGNPQPAATWTTSTSSSTKTGALLSLSLLQDIIYLNISTCWAQTQRSPQAHNA